MTAVKDKNGKIIEGDELKSKRWKEHFNDLYNIQNPVDVSILNVLPATKMDTPDMLDILKNEVESSIASLKPRKAPGIDRITAELWKAGGNEMVSALHRLF